MGNNWNSKFWNTSTLVSSSPVFTKAFLTTNRISRHNYHDMLICFESINALLIPLVLERGAPVDTSTSRIGIKSMDIDSLFTNNRIIGVPSIAGGFISYLSGVFFAGVWENVCFSDTPRFHTNLLISFGSL